MSELVGRGSKHTDQQRRQVVIEYHVNGNDQVVADSTGISRQTINTWRLHSDWWDELLGEVRHEISEHILAQNLEIATKAGERVLDSLENGDEKLVWDKTKNEYVKIRVKPTGKDASVMGGISQDKARVQMGMATSISSSDNTVQALADEFRKLSADHKAIQNSVVSTQDETNDRSR